MWMRNPGPLSENLYLLGTHEVPVYLLRGKSGFALVEGGIAAQADLVEMQLKEIIGLTENIDYFKSHWFLLHSHYDHVGAVSRLWPEISKPALYASPEAMASFSNAKYRQFVERLNREVGDDSAGLDMGSTPFALDPMVMSTMRAGNSIQTSDFDFEVIGSPGHSACSVSLFERNSKTLFCSDALGEYQEPGKILPLIFDNFKQYMESCERLLAVEADRICFGHYGVLEGEALEAFRSTYMQQVYSFLARVRDVARRNGTDECVAEIERVYFMEKQTRFVPTWLFHASIKRMVDLIINEDLDV